MWREKIKHKCTVFDWFEVTIRPKIKLGLFAITLKTPSNPIPPPPNSQHFIAFLISKIIYIFFLALPR